MPFYTFSLTPFSTNSSKTQTFDELAAKLHKIWEYTNDSIALIGNVSMQGKSMDAVLVKQSAICVFSFLDCGGRIEATRTGYWRAGGKPIKGINPYSLLADQTKLLAQVLGNIKAVREIQAIALFQNPIVFNEKASPIADKWFHVSDIESLSRNFFEKQGGLLKRDEIETVLNELGVNTDLFVMTSAASKKVNADLNSAAPERKEAQLSITKNTKSLLSSAQIHVDNLRYYAAILDLDKVIELDFTCYKAHFLRGVANYNLSCFKAAVEDYTRAITLDTTEDRAFFERALAYMKLKEENQALTDLGHAIRLNKYAADYYQKRGEYLFSIGIYKLAIKDFNSYINIKSDNPTTYYYRGCCYEKLEEYADAKADFKMVLRLSPASLQAIEALEGVEQLLQKDKDLEQLKREIVKEPTVNSYNDNALRQNSKLDPAEQAVYQPIKDQSRLKTPEEQAILLYQKGLENQQNSILYDAITDYNKAISLNPVCPILYSQRGLCWLEAENEDRALADFSKALTLAPDNSEVKQHIEKINARRAQKEYIKAINLEKAGDYTGAINCYDSALTLAPNKKFYLYKRGKAKRVTGNLDGALHDFDAAIKLDSLFSKAYNERGDVWQNLGNIESAVKDFAKAVELDPSYTTASINLNYGMYLLEKK